MRRSGTGLSKLSRMGLAGVAAALIGLAAVDSAAAANFSVVHPFCSKSDCRDGEFPLGPLWMDSSGNIFGVTKFGGRRGSGELYELVRRQDGSVKYQTIFGFETTKPEGGVILDTQGNFYGELSNGDFYKISFVTGLKHDRWEMTDLQALCQQQPNCGTNRFGGLTYQGASTGVPWDGVSPLYGTASAGGLNGGGTVFQLAINGNTGTETVLYNFCSQGGKKCTDGRLPLAGLLFDPAGNLYGTTTYGGGTGVSGGGGTVFELTATSGGSWTQTVLYQFCAQNNCADGYGPIGNVIRDAQGNLFGTTAAGGRQCTPFMEGCGTAFKLSLSHGAYEEAVLYAFCAKKDCADGNSPATGLTIDSSGTLFGTTQYGGGNDIDFHGFGGGVAFRLTLSVLDVLHKFCARSNCADGAQPATNLVINSSGQIYGASQFGGEFGTNQSGGAIFTIKQ